MPQFLIHISIVFFAICALAQAANPPNVILILADDLGWADTTLYGNTSLYETPNIERLAARGMTFTNAYAAAPICSPTRASIMSGQTPARLGFTSPVGHVPEVRLEPEPSFGGPPHQKSTNVKSATRLNPSLPTLARLLKNAGFATAHFGKWHLGREPYSPLDFGFDVDIPHWYGPGPAGSYIAPWNYPHFKANAPGEHIEDRMAEAAVAWLTKRDRTKPFFLNYWQFSVHAPFGAKPELIDRYRKKIKRGEATVEDDSLRLTPTGRQAFLTNAKVRSQGPVEFRLRVRTRVDGTARLQWRTEGQELFPAIGQSKSVAVVGGDWQELSVSLAIEGRLVHLRFFLPAPKRPVEIDWIEITPTGGNDKEGQRWDFKDAADPTNRTRSGKVAFPEM